MRRQRNGNPNTMDVKVRLHAPSISFVYLYSEGNVHLDSSNQDIYTRMTNQITASPNSKRTISNFPSEKISFFFFLLYIYKKLLLNYGGWILRERNRWGWGWDKWHQYYSRWSDGGLPGFADVFVRKTLYYFLIKI